MKRRQFLSATAAGVRAGSPRSKSQATNQKMMASRRRPRINPASHP